MHTARTMITLSADKDGTNLHVDHWMTPPTVYLDHWALGDLSEDDQTTVRFARALEAQGGTLAISWVHLAEFAIGPNLDSVRKSESFINANLPRVFLLEPNPFAVIDRENELLSGGSPEPPHADQLLLEAFVKFLGSDQKSSSPTLTAHDLFQIVQDKGLARHKEELADTFIGRITALRGELENDASFRSNLGRPARGSYVQTATRDILRELMRALLIDRRKKVTRNDAMDFFHMVVSVSYCDFVLLDKYWETLVNRVRSRFNQAGESVPMAIVCSKKTNGIERCLQWLESGGSP
jgi:hypothetical protein